MSCTWSLDATKSMTRMMVALGQAAFVHIGMPVMLSIIIYWVVAGRGVGYDMCEKIKI